MADPTHRRTRAGARAAVVQQRMEFQMRDRFEEVIATAVGREVIGFMSGNQQEPT
jgi:hypothetical protein